jgi:hypothetical protein
MSQQITGKIKGVNLLTHMPSTVRIEGHLNEAVHAEVVISAPQHAIEAIVDLYGINHATVSIGMD